MGLNLGAPPAQDVLDVIERDGVRVARFRQPWLEWLKVMGIIVEDVQNSGTTAQRPTESLYPGKPFYDVTLGLPIVYDGTQWTDYAGAPV